MTTKGIALVPEFCMVTGISEETQNAPSKFNLVKDIVNSTQPDIQKRIITAKREFMDQLKY